MNNQWNSDLKTEDILKRAADYLAQRGSEYLEQPLGSPVSSYNYRSRRHRLLLGGVAAITLCLVAVAISFIGGTSSGQVDVAKAAWTAIPSPISQSISDQFAASCDSVISEFWKSDKSNGNSDVPNVLREPTLIDVRGTSKLGVYFGGELILVCLIFDGKNAMVQRIDGFVHSLNAGTKGSVNALTLAVDDRAVGLVFGDLPADSSSVRSVKIQQVEQAEPIEASVVTDVGRYVAWSPTFGDVSVKFEGESSTVMGSLGPTTFLPPCLGSCILAPTTVPTD